MKGKLRDLIEGPGKLYLMIEVGAGHGAALEKLKDCDVAVDLKKWREPRSKDANAYLHLLVNKIAAVTGQADDELKAQLVLRYGALARDPDGRVLGAMLPPSAKVEDYYPYARWYKSMAVNGKPYDCYMFYKRTSDLDTKEMSRLIDGTVYEAQALGIDTDTPEMKARYEKDG